MKNMAKSLIGLILYVVLIFGLAYVLGHFVVGQVIVDGPSMNETLYDQDRVLINKFSYRVSELDRYDVVVFKYAYDTSTDYVKRVIGLPGESVRIDWDGNIYIDGQLLVENYGAETMIDPGIAEEEIKLGSDEYFVLGDNRNNSSDSRDPDVGAVSKSQLKGTVWLRMHPNIEFVK